MCDIFIDHVAIFSPEDAQIVDTWVKENCVGNYVYDPTADFSILFHRTEDCVLFKIRFPQ